MAKTIQPPTYHVESKDGKNTLCGLKLSKAPNRMYYKFRNELLSKNTAHPNSCKACLKEVKAIKAQKKLGL